jgi:Rieske Fe-S protein
MATRRGMLAGVGLAGLAGAISACSAGGSSSSTAGTPVASSQSATVAASTPAAPASSAGGGAAALATTSEIPVGGGMIFTAQKVVVTQPAANEFKAFSAVCTHMGCIVNKISNGTIDCPCHGSQYSIKNGDVVGGPAPNPLPSQAIKITGNDIFLG